MVAKITIPKNIQAALNYNEKKVEQRIAICLHAANYLGEAKNLNFYQKLNGFERLNSLNERATTKTLHVSLNFDPKEKLCNDKLIEIASLYMQKIGFGEQPFIIYKHEDAGHPHIHIVSTTIKEDGNRINTHNIGRNQSETARKELEQMFGLIKAERQHQLMRTGIKSIDIEKAIYGKHETKRSISNVVGSVFNQYKFTTFPEFNAALKQYNVIADRGNEESRIYKNRGLVYRILDAEGNKIGVPIKASLIGCKPTLDNLEKKFIINEYAKEPLKQKTKNAIDECLEAQPGSLKNFINALMQKQIYTVLRENTEGRLYGITFIDNQNKCVFNGSDLGKGYSISGLQNRVGFVNKQQENIYDYIQKENQKKPLAVIQKNSKSDNDKNLITKKSTRNDSVVKQLLSAKSQNENAPIQLLKKKPRKKKRYFSF